MLLFLYLFYFSICIFSSNLSKLKFVHNETKKHQNVTLHIETAYIIIPISICSFILKIWKLFLLSLRLIILFYMCDYVRCISPRRVLPNAITITLFSHRYHCVILSTSLIALLMLHVIQLITGLVKSELSQLIGDQVVIPFVNECPKKARLSETCFMIKAPVLSLHGCY